MGSQTSTSRHAPLVDLEDGQTPDFSSSPPPLPPGLRAPLHREDLLSEEEDLLLLWGTPSAPPSRLSSGSSSRNRRRSCDLWNTRAGRIASGMGSGPHTFFPRPQQQQHARVSVVPGRPQGHAGGEEEMRGEAADAKEEGKERGRGNGSGTGEETAAAEPTAAAEGEEAPEPATAPVCRQGEAETEAPAGAVAPDERVGEAAADHTREGTRKHLRQQQQDAGDTHGEELIPCVFTWTHGGHSVYLTGSFNNWSLTNKIRLNRSGHEFSYIQNLPRGLHFYKFIVDDEWRFAPDQRTQSDEHGNINNVLDISNFAKFDFALPSEIEEAREGQYHQAVPEPSEYSTDAPTIPILLGKSAHAYTDPPPVVGAGIPVHCLANHLFHDSCAPRVFGPHTSCIATTHRWQPTNSRSASSGQRYTTYIYVTVNPLYPFPSAAEDASVAAAEDLESCAAAEAAAAAAAGVEVHTNPLANMLVYTRRDAKHAR